MNTHPDERLPFLELARQEARVVRDVPAAELERLNEVAPGAGSAHVDMSFSLDADRRPRVSGRVDVVAAPTCQRCLERFERQMRVDFELRIVRDPELASALAGEMDVLVADSDSVTIADVVEDELLLALPERLCTEEPCRYAPDLEYPDADAPEPEQEENPFHVLSRLKR